MDSYYKFKPEADSAVGKYVDSATAGISSGIEENHDYSGDHGNGFIGVNVGVRFK